jgi:putative spermidine/putrescine transport system permease protein
MVLALMVSVQKIDENQLLAAANLGASRFAIIREVVLPLSLPGVVAGSVLVFTMAASAYATPMLLGGTKTKVAATEIYNLAIQYADWSSAAVLAIALFVMTAVVVLLGTVFSESGKRKVIFQ